MLILTLNADIMSQFGLPNPKDEEEGIEWGRITNRNACLLVAYWKRGSCKSYMVDRLQKEQALAELQI